MNDNVMERVIQPLVAHVTKMQRALDGNDAAALYVEALKFALSNAYLQGAVDAMQEAP